MVRVPSGHHLVLDCLLLHPEDLEEPELDQELQEELPEGGGEEVGDELNQSAGLWLTLGATQREIFLQFRPENILILTNK